MDITEINTKIESTKDVNELLALAKYLLRISEAVQAANSTSNHPVFIASQETLVKQVAEVIDTKRRILFGPPINLTNQIAPVENVNTDGHKKPFISLQSNLDKSLYKRPLVSRNCISYDHSTRM